MSKTFKAAKTLCTISGWSLTNLEIQKILYIANRVFIGRHNKQLVDNSFEAWDYGPVLPNIYKECKMYGNKPVQVAFLLSREYEEGSEERAMILEAYEHLKGFSGGQLVSMTHREGGAWASVYNAGARNIKIPTDKIKEEYEAIQKK